MAKTALYVNQQPGGLFGIEDQSRGTGSRFFVHATTGTDAAGYGLSPDAPVASLDYAIGLCTAAKGDIIYLMPGHAETTTAIAADIAGVQIVGLGRGRNRPALTATTGATDLVNVTAANVSIENVRLIGAASGNTALVDLSTAATDFEARRCSFEQAATPLKGITISADRFSFVDCDFSGSANGPDYAISIETKVHDWRIEDCRFFYKSGLDNGLIESAKACTGYIIKDIVAVGLDTLVVNFTSSSAGAPDGLLAGAHVMYSAAIASVEDGLAAATSKGLAISQVYATDATGVAAGRIPLTTAS